MVARRTNRIVLTVTAIVALLAFSVSVYAFSLGKYDKVKATGGEVLIPVAKVGDKAKFFKLEDNGKEIAFFVVKAADGTYKAAFDACDACYKSKKGYEQQADKMNCKNCNQKFAINRLGPNATGGCNPGYLPHRQIGGNISIKLNDIKSGAGYF